MEIMKTSIKAILNNIVDAEQYLDKDAINSFEDTIIAANNI